MGSIGSRVHRSLQFLKEEWIDIRRHPLRKRMEGCSLQDMCGRHRYRHDRQKRCGLGRSGTKGSGEEIGHTEGSAKTSELRGYLARTVGRALTTTATKGSVNFWLFICVSTSIPESQHPYPGCEWYHPIAFSSRCTYIQGPNVAERLRGVDM